MTWDARVMQPLDTVPEYCYTYRTSCTAYLSFFVSSTALTSHRPFPAQEMMSPAFTTLLAFDSFQFTLQVLQSPHNTQTA